MLCIAARANAKHEKNFNQTESGARKSKREEGKYCKLRIFFSRQIDLSCENFDARFDAKRTTQSRMNDRRSRFSSTRSCTEITEGHERDGRRGRVDDDGARAFGSYSRDSTAAAVKTPVLLDKISSRKLEMQIPGNRAEAESRF